ncbi:hypothetical protein [Flagellimonas marinaquae]|uniref:hypothetical protein n=1 Tax=Flagellimonas marinaquae TaxID=254955 RepID=UPI002074EB2D|nr:hypothetical protein [Allomuricauda aquimarina]USD25832.1 hypothetical protein MJO53_02800 [Allomuricauda aquimarina]
MAKLEKHIKQKLEERTIVPSDGAWNKIASQLEQPVPKKRNTWFMYAVAASVVGVVLVSAFFFTKDNGPTEQMKMVGNEIKNEKVIEAEEIKAKENNQIDVAETKSKVTKMQKLVETPLPNVNPNTAIATKDNRQPLKDDMILNPDKLIAQKVEEVVAQVELMESVRQDVSDAEVDSLLRAAQRQILTDKLFSESGTVDAMSLLAEVEDELDESFRDQIFDALKSGYLKLRTAVADRNQ